MKKKLFILGALILVLLLPSLFGCIYNSKDKKINYELIAEEKTLPYNFHQMAYESNTKPYSKILLKKSVEHSDFKNTWRLYGFNNNLPNVDFNLNYVLFIGLQESGNCPYKIENIERSSGKKSIKIPLKISEDSCTFDSVPKTFVIQIDKVLIKDIENVMIVQGAVVTKIPLSN